MESIILIGHGSPRKKANRMDEVVRLMHAKLHPGCDRQCVRAAYMGHDTPSIDEAIDMSAAEGATRVFLHPYFLSAGVHVTKDIPGIIEGAKKRHPGVDFRYTEPLGLADEIVQVAIDRVSAARGIAPTEIEAQSFETIAREANMESLPANTHPIVKRVIHTTADFEYLSTIVIHPEAVEAGVRAIRAGKDILTDVEMVRSGINHKALKSFGGKVVCHIGEVESTDTHTRSELGMDAGLKDNIGIVAIGNAPTALIRCIELMDEGKASPDLVVGVPVGFVRAVESKSLLASRAYPHITNTGRKGGSPVAAAIVNALIKIAQQEQGND